MRFETKFDRWLVILLIVAALATCSLPAARLLIARSHPTPLGLTVLPFAIWAVVLSSTLPQYYELHQDSLFLRVGWRRVVIPYASLVEIQSMSDTRSAGVFSADRILLVTEAGKRFIIAVAEQERFLAELSQRCPQLEPRPFGFGMPFSPTTIL